MKYQTNSNKMLLTTALLAVLGVNYSFQVSSLKLNQNGVFEAASAASPAASVVKPAAKVADKTKKPKAEKPAPPKEEVAKTEAGTAETAPAAPVQAYEVDLSKCTDGTCKNIPDGAKILVTYDQTFRGVLAKITPTDASPKIETTSIDKDKKEEALSNNECMVAENPKKETRKERKEREECELKAKAEGLEEEFTEAMDKLKDKCDNKGDDEIQCLTDGYSSEIKKAKYYGKGRKEILSTSFAKQEFKNLIGAKLTKKLNGIDANDPEALEKMKSLITGLVDAVPENYDLKKLTMDSLKSHVASRANSVVQLYNQARAADKTNPDAALMARKQAMVEANEFISTTNTYLAAVENTDYMKDTSNYKYYSMNYLPSIRRMLMAVNNPLSKDIDGNLATIDNKVADQNSNVQATTQTRNQNRGSGNVVSNNGGSRMANESQQQNVNFNISGQGQAWTAPATTNGVQVGAPRPSSQIQDRGASRGGSTAPTRIGNTNAGDMNF